MTLTSGGGASGGGGGGGGTASGGGAGGIPLLVLIVMIEPGMVLPVGVVPTTAPLDEKLLIGVGRSLTWKPASRSRFRAASKLRPVMLGTVLPGPPST